MTPRRPLRVAVITPNPTPYRAPFFRYLAGMDEIDLKVFFLTRGSATRPWRVEAAGFEHEFLREFSLPAGGKDSARYRINPGVIPRLRRGRFDAVVIAGYNHFTTQAAILYCTLTRTPWCLMSESHLRKERSPLRVALKDLFLRPFLLRMGAAMVTGTLAARYIESFGVPRDCVFTVANTPDVERLTKAADELAPRREMLRERLGVAGRSVILFVGRLLPEKGLETLFDAYGAASREIDEPALVVAGEGPLRGALEKRAADEDLPRVKFLGFVQPEELSAVYAAADVFVLPSLVEPWGVVVNEAMAAGLPVILSERVGAAADLVIEGENGHVVPAGDAGALAGKITAVLGDEDARRAMGAKSREIIAGWNYSTSARNFIDAAKCAVERKGGGA